MITPAARLLRRAAPDARRTSRIGHYLAWLSDQRNRHFTGYEDLWRWSISDIDGFWESIWAYFDLDSLQSASGDGPATASVQMPGAQWFPGRTLNYAEAVLRMPGRQPDDVVLIAESQSRPPVTFTAAELRQAVARAQAGLLGLGIRRGDRVCAYAPNIPETLILMLACASLGAVFSSCATEFGVSSVVDRLRQVEPRLLLAVDGYVYGSRRIDRADQVEQIRAGVPSIETVVWLPYLDPAFRPSGGEDLTWDGLTSAHPGELAFEQTGFSEPLYILYSSGTTGLPKPIVHGHGGITLEHLKCIALHMDLGPEDRFFWFTTTGWMMWNFLMSGPATGASIVMFDGDPASPDLSALWDLVQRTGTTFFGTSATFIQQSIKNQLELRTPQRALSALRGMGSTGSPLPAEGFQWVFDRLGSGIQLTSLAGGTDVCTGFLGGSPLHDTYAGQIACRHLGCRVEAFDADGHSVIGEVGELVVTAPMPSMPVGFWADGDGRRMHEAYYSRYPGVWRHGDWLIIDEAGRCTLTGRSDATLNRGGVRLGTAEFYSVVEALDGVQDSLVIHLEDPSGGAGQLILFVVPAGPASATQLEPALRDEIRASLRSQLSPRHLPDLIVPVAELPRTLSGKKVEVPIKRILSGTPVEQAVAAGSLANPAALDVLLRTVRSLLDGPQAVAGDRR